MRSPQAVPAVRAETVLAVPHGTGRKATLALIVALALAVAAAGAACAWRYLDERTSTVQPFVPSLRMYDLFVDDTPVALTVTAAWVRVPHVATADAVRRDAGLWRRMHIGDWDTVPSPLREEGLDALLARHAPLLTTPARWDHMTPHDWDAVPQPIRVLAFRHMLQYWTGFYQVGRQHGLAPRLVADTAAAIVLSESWFEHRAVNVNPFGVRDLGLAQASDFARLGLADLYAQGASDVVLGDADYFDPWSATRFVAIWLAHLLHEVDGDLSAAVGAYHRGVTRALAGEDRARAYATAVLRRREQYIRDPSGSPAWRHLWERDRELTREAWPWLHSRRVLRNDGRETSALDRAGDAQPTWWRLALAPAPGVRQRQE